MFRALECLSHPESFKFRRPPRPRQTILCALNKAKAFQVWSVDARKEAGEALKLESCSEAGHFKAYRMRS